MRQQRSAGNFTSWRIIIDATRAAVHEHARARASATPSSAAAASSIAAAAPGVGAASIEKADGAGYLIVTRGPARRAFDLEEKSVLRFRMVATPRRLNDMSLTSHHVEPKLLTRRIKISPASWQPLKYNERELLT